MRAQQEAKKGNTQAITLADIFCREARVRIDHLFSRFFGPDDDAIYKVSQEVLRGEHAWLEEGIIGLSP